MKKVLPLIIGVIGLGVAVLVVGGILLDSDKKSETTSGSSAKVDCTDKAKAEANPQACAQTKYKALITGNAHPIGDDAKTVGLIYLMGETSPVILTAYFSNYPDPKAGKFYEGWLLNKASGKNISTGKLVKKTDDKGSTWTNVYKSETTLDGYDQYILTVETEGGAASSEEHIAVADLAKVSQ